MDPPSYGRGPSGETWKIEEDVADFIDLTIGLLSDDPLFVQDGFTDVPYECFPDGEYLRLDPIRICSYTLKPDARVQSRITKKNETYDFVYTYENSDGNRFLVFPFSARTALKSFGYFKSYRRKRQLIDAYEYIGGNPLDAYVDGKHPSLYTIVKRDKDVITVGLWNLFEDKTDSVKIKVNREPKSVRFIGCEGNFDEDCVTVTSTLYPYEFCAVKIY
jgi:hypothetical protein